MAYQQYRRTRPLVTESRLMLRNRNGMTHPNVNGKFDDLPEVDVLHFLLEAKNKVCLLWVASGPSPSYQANGRFRPRADLLANAS